MYAFRMLTIKKVGEHTHTQTDTHQSARIFNCEHDEGGRLNPKKKEKASTRSSRVGKEESSTASSSAPTYTAAWSCPGPPGRRLNRAESPRQKACRRMDRAAER